MMGFLHTPTYRCIGCGELFFVDDDELDAKREQIQEQICQGDNADFHKLEEKLCPEHGTRLDRGECMACNYPALAALFDG